MIAWLGTGLLGANFVRKLLERGETVHVWNRTPEKAHALEADGAKAFDQPIDAVRGASEIHLTLSDDAAVDSVLDPLADVILPTAFIADAVRQRAACRAPLSRARHDRGVIAAR